MRRPQSLAPLGCVRAGAAHPSGVLLTASTSFGLVYSLRPAGSRARRRPHAEGCRWALQPISLLGITSAGVKRYRGGQQKTQRVRLEESVGPQPSHCGGPKFRIAQSDPPRAAIPHNYPSVDRAHREKPFFPRAPGKSCSKTIHAFERFPPHPRRAHPSGVLLAASTLTSLYPYKPIPYKSLPDKRKLPSGRAGPACPRRAMGSLYPQSGRLTQERRPTKTPPEPTSTPPLHPDAPASV